MDFENNPHAGLIFITAQLARCNITKNDMKRIHMHYNNVTFKNTYHLTPTSKTSMMKINKYVPLLHIIEYQHFSTCNLECALNAHSHFLNCSKTKGLSSGRAAAERSYCIIRFDFMCTCSGIGLTSTHIVGCNYRTLTRRYNLVPTLKPNIPDKNPIPIRHYGAMTTCWRAIYGCRLPKETPCGNED